MGIHPKALLGSLIAMVTGLALVAYANTLVVVVDQPNVRTETGRTYDVVETIQKNERFESLGEQHGWYQISAKGMLGWVSTKAGRVDERDRGGAPSEGSLHRNLRLYNHTWAVVIGIDRYPNLDRREQLGYAVSDAKAIEKLLRDELRFDQVKSLYNQDATKNDVLAALNTYLAKTDKEDAVFVFFAGHGHTESTPYGDVGYILPHDGSFNSMQMYRNISMTELAMIIASATLSDLE